MGRRRALVPPSCRAGAHHALDQCRPVSRFLLMSGLQIFNAHPALYVGERSDFRPSNDFDPGTPVGKTALFGRNGRSSDIHSIRRACSASRARTGQVSSRAFPSWITIPKLPRISRLDGRWHFFFLRLAIGAECSHLSRLGHRQVGHFGRARVEAWPYREGGPANHLRLPAFLSREARRRSGTNVLQAVRLFSWSSSYCFRS